MRRWRAVGVACRVVELQPGAPAPVFGSACGISIISLATCVAEKLFRRSMTRRRQWCVGCVNWLDERRGEKKPALGPVAGWRFKRRG
jgi:hypothetical protein